MKTVLIGEYIKQKREELQMTQEDLCSGICTTATLSRVENGRQTPSRKVINALLRRLGAPTDRFFALVTENELETEQLMKDIQNGCICLRRAGQDRQPAIREEVLAKLSRLDEITEDDDNITRQYILGQKSLLGGPDGSFSFEEKMDILMSAIRLTIPGFNLGKIYLNRYSIIETSIIIDIALTYSRAGEKRKAIDIYRQLLHFIEDHDPELTGYAEHFCLISHNYAIILAHEGHYEEAIEIASQGRQVSVEKNVYQHLPGFLAILAECYFFTHNEKESRDFYIMAYCTYRAFGDEPNLSAIKTEMKDRLGMEPPV